MSIVVTRLEFECVAASIRNMSTADKEIMLASSGVDPDVAEFIYRRLLETRMIYVRDTGHQYTYFTEMGKINLNHPSGVADMLNLVNESD